MVSIQTLDFDLEPLSDEPELESSLHLAQIILLLTCLEWWWQDRQDFFAAGNLSIYYRPDPPIKMQFNGPDFFVAINVERRPRNSWVVSGEGNKFPNLIVEILSPKTAKIDRGRKKELYQNVFKTPEYFWFDPRPKRLDFIGFRLKNGQYQEISLNEQGWRWSEELQLYLGVIDGKLRYFTPDGVMIPNFEEATAQQEEVINAVRQRLQRERQRAEQERQRAEQERQRAEQECQRAEQEHQQAAYERQRANRLAEQLRALGIDPDQE